MTRDEYGSAYQSGFYLTVQFLCSRGVLGEAASEAAQAGWARGWERIQQLRQSSMVVAWVNSIALNQYRSDLRKPALEPLPGASRPPAVEYGTQEYAIDAERILRLCDSQDGELLKLQYLEELGISEIAQRQGCSETAARIRILRARRAIRERIVRGRFPAAA